MEHDSKESIARKDREGVFPIKHIDDGVEHEVIIRFETAYKAQGGNKDAQKHVCDAYWEVANVDPSDSVSRVKRELLSYHDLVIGTSTRAASAEEINDGLRYPGVC